MLRHVVLFRWVPGTTAEQIAAVGEALDRLPKLIPAIHAYSHGPDLALGEGRLDYGIVADFEDVDAYRVYDADLEHERSRAEVIRPLIAERVSVQFDLG